MSRSVLKRVFYVSVFAQWDVHAHSARYDVRVYCVSLGVLPLLAREASEYCSSDS